MSNKSFSIFAILVVGSLLLAACSAPAAAPVVEAPVVEAPSVELPAEEAPATEAPAVAPEVDPMAIYAPEAVEGNVVTAGSSTVFPLSERMAELFQDEGFTGSVTVDSIGSGGGFERFCESGETDIANASRAIKDSEVESCKAIGREPIELRVGTDALAVVVSSENNFLTNLSIEQLGQILSGTLTTWNQIDPAFPAEKILVFSPGADSGTFDYMVEATLEEMGGKEALLGLDGAQFSEDDNFLVQGVVGSPYAIGYFGFAYYVENMDTLKAVSIEGVSPEQASVDAGTYPLARPLFMYTDAKILAEKPQVVAFVNFYLTNVNDNIVDVGYFPAPAADLEASVAAFMSAIGQ